jgi:hypothetical protein
MTRTRAAIVGALLAAAVAALPVASVADTQSTQNYATVLTQTGPAAEFSSFTGVLKLSVSSNGIVQGWYMPDYATYFIPVTGSSKDGRLWLSIGESGQLQVNASVQRGGKIVGSAFETGPPLPGSVQGPATYNFVANPKANNVY